jgi:hypothetical protein
LLNLEKKVSLYVVALLLFVGIIGSVIFGALVRHALLGNASLGSFGEGLLKIAEFPSTVKIALTEIETGSPLVLKDGRFPNLDGFKKDGKVPSGAKNDKGYLLLSSYDAEKEQSTVQLIRIADQKSLYEWAPDFAKLAEHDQIKHLDDEGIMKLNYIMRHPLLTDDGGIVFHKTSPQFRINACSEVEMVVDDIFHHSTEIDADGNYWSPSVMYSSSFKKGVLNHKDDAIAQISPEGKVLFKKSVAEILYENGYRGLLAAGFDEDPIHLNDIQPALTDSHYWKKNDLLISMRHMSTIMLYRPSTNKVIWLKTGPWMNQHDVNFVGDHELSVFGNNIITDVGVLKVISGNGIRVGAENVFMDGHNNVYRYNFQTDKVVAPYNEVMKSMGVSTGSEGRGTILENGDVFVEEQNNGRILRMSPEGVKWEFVRRVDKDHITTVSWSRYLTKEEVLPILTKLRSQSCK